MEAFIFYLFIYIFLRKCYRTIFWKSKVIKTESPKGAYDEDQRILLVKEEEPKGASKEIPTPYTVIFGEQNRSLYLLLLWQYSSSITAGIHRYIGSRYKAPLHECLADK